MNRSSWWQKLLVLVAIIFGSVYLAPNFFGSSPGLQIKGLRGASVSTDLIGDVDSQLKKEDIVAIKTQWKEDSLLLGFSSTEDQKKAVHLLGDNLSDSYTVALSDVSLVPSWLSNLGASPLYLGLDLRGGVHFLLEVDTERAVQRLRETYVGYVKSTLQDNNLRYHFVKLDANKNVHISMRRAKELDVAVKVIKEELPNAVINVIEGDSSSFSLNPSEEELLEIKTSALDQNMTALRNRVDQMGVSEPIVQKQGVNRIVIQLPGVQDTARAKKIIGQAATLEMRMVDESNQFFDSSSALPPPDSKVFRFRDGREILLKKNVIYSGENIINAMASIDVQTGNPIVNITLDSTGAAINQRVTAKNVGNRMAVVYLEISSELQRDENGKVLLDDSGTPLRVVKKIEEVLTAPVIRSQIGKRYQIEGIGNMNEARDLALMLRAGSLAAPIEIVEERTVGPSLGKDNIKSGVISIIAGLALILLFMAFYYRSFGLAANFALVFNLGLLTAILSLLQATLTLPGVAGIVLTVGMAVDANVLIFERIREELRLGNSPQASIHVGYDKAFSTIMDANVTTLIAALVLFHFGTGPIKGFAVTLSIGILTSFFTAIVLTRVIVNAWYGGKSIEKLKI